MLQELSVPAIAPENTYVVLFCFRLTDNLKVVTADAAAYAIPTLIGAVLGAKS